MILYALFTLSLFLLLLFNRAFKEKFYFVISLVLVVVYWGLSYIDVPDTPGYQSVYASLNPKVNPQSSVITHFEVGFLYLMWLFKKIGADYYLFQLFLFTVESFLVFLGIKKLGNDYHYLGSIVCLLGFWLPVVLMGALRQGVVIAIFIYSLHMLLEKKYYLFVLLVLISFFFHKSAVFLLVVPLWYLFTNLFINKRLILLVIFVLINVLHFSGYTLLSSFDNVLSVFFTDVSEQDLSISEYSIYAGSNVGESNFGLLKLLEVDFCYIVALLLYPEKNSKAFQLLTSLFLVFFVLNMLVGGIIIHRITYYLQIPYFLLLFRSFMSVLSRFKIGKQGQYVFVFLYVFLTNLILSKPFSPTAIHEYHIFDVLGL